MGRCKPRDFDSNVNVSAAGRGIQIAARVAW
jgi:hypothetical protein